MSQILSTWWGMTLFILFDIIAVIVIIAVNYKWLFKPLFDFIFSLAFIIILSPLLIVLCIISKVHVAKIKDLSCVFTEKLMLGKKEKIFPLYSFTVEAEDGSIGKYGNFLRKSKLEKLPVLFNIFYFNLSFIGIKPLRPMDKNFICEEDEERFLAKPGLISPLVREEKNNTRTYEEMFETEINYAKNISFFKDLLILLTALIQKLRAEKENLFGEAKEKDYATVLLEDSSITQEDYNQALEEEKEEYENYNKSDTFNNFLEKISNKDSSAMQQQTEEDSKEKNEEENQAQEEHNKDN